MQKLATYIVFDQNAMHQCILFERYLHTLSAGDQLSQKQLFPQNIDLPPQDAAIMREILPEINNLGFVISEFGANSFIIHSFPADIDYRNERQIIDEFIEQFKTGTGLGKFSRRENVAKSLSFTAAIKAGKVLSALEMQNLIDELFACENPNKAPNGRKTFVKYAIEDLEKAFDK